MPSTDREPSPSEDLGPDPVPENHSGVFERPEWLFIAFFILLIGVGSLQRWKESRSDFHPISLEGGEESLAAGPVDWTRPLEALPLESKDLNQVTRTDLLALPGVGPVLADGILESRRRRGKFLSYEELDEVPGIGPSRLETLRPFLHVTLEVENSAPTSVSFDSSSPLAQVAANSPKGGIPHSENPSKPDLNSMTLEELQAIPGVGQAFASRILEKKNELGGFQTWEQVGSIHGIGPKRLENLRGHARLR